MKYCNCRDVSTADVNKAFNQSQLDIADLSSDKALIDFYALCVNMAIARGAIITSKPLEERCPPCREGFRRFVFETLEPV